MKYEFLKDNLRHIMQVKGWTLVEFSRNTGITPQTLGNIMSGRTSPTIKTFLAICEAGGFHPRYFFAEVVDTSQQE